MILRLFFLKEWRKYPFFFLLVIFTLTLGTVGLLGINIIAGQVQEKLGQNAKELLSSDISLSTRKPFLPAEEKTIRGIMREKAIQSYQVIDIYSMISHSKSGQSRLVEIRATEGEYPFYGEIQVDEGNFSPEKIYISEDLARLWGIQKGDELFIGELKANVEGIVTQDSSLGFRGFSLAPRVYFPLSRLKETGLLKPGATGNFAWHFKLPDSDREKLRNLKQQIYSRVTDPAIRVSLPEDTSEQSGRVISIISNFMSLSALIGLVLSLVGVFYLYQSHLLSRLRDLSLFHLFGLTRIQIAGGVVLQFSLLFLVVLLLQVILILPGYRAIVPALSESLGLDLPLTPKLDTLINLLPVLFALTLSILVPLLMGLMRTSLGAQLKAAKLSMGRFRFYDFIPFLILLWIFSVHLSQNTRMGSFFFAALLVIFAASTLMIKLVQWPLQNFIKGKGLLLPTIESGISMRNLVRSGHKLTLSFLSLAMGAALISLILQLDHKIQGELSLSGDKPGLFIFDIQEEQLQEFTEFAQSFGTPLEAITPMVRARLEEVNGKRFERKKSPFAMRSRDDEEDPRTRNNAVNLTYRGYLTPAEKIVAGAPFPQREPDPEAPALVSLEKRWAERMGVNLGDKLLFDVQGVSFPARVHNIKEIKWTSFYPNFFITVEPGFLEPAPQTYLAAFPSGEDERKLEFQRESVTRFPNISFINVEELVSKLAGLFERAREAIEIISWLSLCVGLVILYGLSHDQVYRRQYDLALMKSLGFTAGRLRLNLILEFGSLFLLSIITGFLLGWLMASMIGREIFKLGWGVDWSRMLLPALFLSVLCLFTIIFASWRAVRSKPRELLSDS